MADHPLETISQVVLRTNPEDPMSIATKKYVDDAVAGGSGAEGEFLPLAGGTMTGRLLLSTAPAADLEAATKNYVDANFVPVSEMKTYIDQEIAKLRQEFLRRSGSEVQ